jgi:hypothetical protein
LTDERRLLTDLDCQTAPFNGQTAPFNGQTAPFNGQEAPVDDDDLRPRGARSW